MRSRATPPSPTSRRAHPNTFAPLRTTTRPVGSGTASDTARTTTGALVSRGIDLLGRRSPTSRIGPQNDCPRRTTYAGWASTLRSSTGLRG